MPRHVIGYLILLLAACPASAQVETYDLPPGTVGIPYTLDLGEGLQDLTSVPGLEFSYSFTVTGGTAPPGLSLKSNGLLSGTPTAAGNFTFNIRFQFVFRFEGLPVSEFSFDYILRMQVTGGSGPAVVVEPTGVVFGFSQGSGPDTRVLSIQNRSNLARTFTATASASGGNWLTVSPASAGAAPFGIGTISVSANPGSLAVGTYSGRITITVTGIATPFVIPVTMSISGGQQAILLSQAGMTFRAVQGSPAQQSQSFNVINAGGGALNWTATTSTLSGGANWLSITPGSGRSDAASSPEVEVRVNPSGLVAGDYYGRVQVAGPGVANSPQTVSVVLNVAPATPAADPLLSTTGLIFVGQAGGTNPAVQNVRVTNIGTAAINFNTGRTFENGNNWFSTPLLSGTIAPAANVSVPVQANLAGLAAGVYRGELSMRFAESQTQRRIAVLLIVVPRPPAASKENFADGCTPTTLIPVFTQLGSGFKIVAAWPSTIEVRVVDDCGTNISTGTVVSTFSNGDPPLPLLSLKDGRWTGTWTPRGPAAQVTITARARTTSPVLEGVSGIGGGAQANTSTPVISSGGVISAASFAKDAPVAPGAFVSIFGERLAQGLTVSPGLPFGTELAGTEVIIGGKSAPIYYILDGQIGAVIPFDVPANTQQQMIIRRGTAFSVPEQVSLAAAQPAVFTQNQQGTGYGAIIGAKPDGTQFIVNGGHRVSAGDVLVIYCAGLGAVSPPVAAGSAAPSAEPLARTVSGVTVTVGGRSATVLFSGLAPTYAGLYQVNAVVPEGIAAAAEVPLTLTVDGQTSPPVNIAVQ